MIDELTPEEINRTLAQIRILESSGTALQTNTTAADIGITRRLRNETSMIVGILLDKLNEVIKKVNDLDNRVGG